MNCLVFNPKYMVGRLLNDIHKSFVNRSRKLFRLTFSNSNSDVGYRWHVCEEKMRQKNAKNNLTKLKLNIISRNVLGLLKN